ncbi:c-type cytochrome [Rubripirellula sp.]|nr:c-type cytochrome [Rubripirellula sp.]
MIQRFFFGLILCLGCQFGFAEHLHWAKKTLTAEFVSEGACVADVDLDGNVDLVSGFSWWRGPNFNERYEYREGKPFDPKGYSDHFFSFCTDVNSDGRQDIIRVGFPGQNAVAYLNPVEPVETTRWESFVLADQVANESPVMIDLIAGGLPELVCSRAGAFGYYQASGDNPMAPWTWVAVSEGNVTAVPFGHGLGVGDVDGDGRLDIVDPTRWWKQPNAVGDETLWDVETWALEPYGSGGAQILVHDVDRDGLNDIITSHHAHGYGLSWFGQKHGEDGRRRFLRHGILGNASIDNPFGVVFSQLHALALADINGDGYQDVVTGKRWWAHGGNDPGGNQAPVLYWFSGAPDEQGEYLFQPSMIDDASGVGTEVVVTDLNGDTFPDVVSSNKRGVAVHLQHRHHDVSDAKGQDAAIRRPENALMARWDQGAENDQHFATSRTPAEAAKGMEVPEGFSIDLVTSEPDLAQPIAMCFDTRGRIWVAEGHTYPVRAAEGEGKDRIVILEDTNGDGEFETHKVFADNLNLISGIQVGFGGVWVGAAPYLMFIPDEDGDDRPDAEPQVLLDGWGYQDTHETLNSFTWGPDGWLYGSHGVFTHSKVGKPGTPDDQRAPLNAAIWRYHPTRHEFEVFSWGGSNSWGIDFNDQGDWFMECCVIPHLFHVIQGARYHRQAGQHFSPYVYEDLPTIADHLHYGDGSFGSMREGGRVDRDLVAREPVSTSMVGGGHAHCGMSIYLGDTFPASYYGDLFFYNLHGHRLVREAVVSDGSGYTGQHRPDLMRSTDHAFVGVTVMLGVDGSLYFSDWHDPQTCHHRDPDIWDRTNGRIFRMRYGDAGTTNLNLAGEEDAALLQSLLHANGAVARHAALVLQERAHRKTLDRQAALDFFEEQFGKATTSRDRLRLFWAAHRCQLLDLQSYLQKMQHGDEYVRGWAIQLFAEEHESRSMSDWQALLDSVAGDSSLVVARYLASSLQRMPLGLRSRAAALIVSNPLFERDKNLSLLVWYGIEPEAADALAEPERASVVLQTFAGAGSIRTKLIRRSASSEVGREALLAALAKNDRYDLIVSDLRELQRWLPEAGKLTAPKAWSNLMDHTDGMMLARKSDEQNLTELVRQLGVRFGDPRSLPYYRDLVTNQSAAKELRARSLELLRQAGDREVVSLAAALLVDPDLCEAATRVIVNAADPGVADQVISALPGLSMERRGDLVNYLAARPETASKLVSAVHRELIESSAVSTVFVRQMHAHQDEKLKASIENIWGKVRTTPEDYEKQKDYWKRIITANRLANADAEHGRFVFETSCGNCHQMFGVGQAIGPDLTGSNRTNLDYVLENVLAPNALIGNAYQMHTFLMSDGRLVSGLIREEGADLVKVIMTGGTAVALPVDEIESRKLSDQSLMPMGLFEKMNAADVVDLVAYLSSSRQVPLRKQRDIPSGGKDPSNVLEAEWLVDRVELTAGRVQEQGMSGFPDRWSGDSQLWWTDAKKGARIKLSWLPPHEGVCNVFLYLTTAVDYPVIRAKVNESAWETADLYSQQVLQLKTPIEWTVVSLDKNSPLEVEIEMVGANPDAIQSWMLGIDRVEVVPVAETR